MMSLIDKLKLKSKQVFTKKNISRSLLFAIIPALLFYSISLLVLTSSGFEIMEVIRDTAQQTEASSFLGFLSNIGIWFWVSSAAICFFTIATRGSALKKNHKQLILLTGILSILLAIDDFFLIHDRYINQYICYFVYALLAGVILIRHHKLILEIEGFAFLLAGALLALSICTDVVQFHLPLEYSYTQIIEEGFKFTGGATWLYFNARIAASH